jgi:hypothetical protein
MKRWSKLQKELYLIIDPKINFQIHCAAYPIGSHNDTIPRYWITLDKEIIFDYPKQFAEYWETNWEMVYPLEYVVRNISDLIREYIDTPVSEILTKHFEHDRWELTDIFRAADRRIGQRRLRLLQNSSKNLAVQKILAQRIKGD